MTEVPMQSETSISWPPPPENTIVSISAPFKNIQLTAKGYISDFRTGELTVDSNGVALSGKAILRAEILFWILIVCLPFIGWLIPALICEYLIRPSRSLSINWENIESIRFDPKKRRAAIVYKQTNNRGKTKFYSLVTNLTPQDYESFYNTVHDRFADKTQIDDNGRFRSTFTPVFLWTLLANFMLIAIVYGLTSAMKH